MARARSQTPAGVPPPALSGPSRSFASPGHPCMHPLSLPPLQSSGNLHRGVMSALLAWTVERTQDAKVLLTGPSYTGAHEGLLGRRWGGEQAEGGALCPLASAVETQLVCRLWPL